VEQRRRSIMVDAEVNSQALDKEKRPDPY